MPEETVPKSEPQAVPEAAAYRPLSGAAIVACVLGVVSLSAFLTPALWIVSLAGVLAALWAWFHIHQYEPPLSGRTSVLAGLLFSVFAAVGAPVQWSLQRYLLGREAEQFAMLFFNYLLQDQPHKAHQLSRTAFERAPLDDHLWDKYPPDSTARKDIEAFLERKEVRAVILLGKDPRTKVRRFSTEKIWYEQGETKVAQSFAVTYYDPHNVKRTFFLTMILNRHPLRAAKVSDWYVSDISSYTAPRILEDRKKAWEKAREGTRREVAQPIEEPTTDQTEE